MQKCVFFSLLMVSSPCLVHGVCPNDADVKISITNFHYFELRIHTVSTMCKSFNATFVSFLSLFSIFNRNSVLSPSFTWLRVAWQVRILVGRSLQAQLVNESGKLRQKKKRIPTQPNIFDVIFFKSIQIPFQMYKCPLHVLSSSPSSSSSSYCLKCRIAKIVPLDGIFTLIRKRTKKKLRAKRTGTFSMFVSITLGLFFWLSLRNPKCVALCFVFFSSSAFQSYRCRPTRYVSGEMSRQAANMMKTYLRLNFM